MSDNSRIKGEFDAVVTFNQGSNFSANVRLQNKFPEPYAELGNIGKSFLEISEKYFGACLGSVPQKNKVSTFFIARSHQIPEDIRYEPHIEYYFTDIVFCVYPTQQRLASCEGSEFVVVTRKLSLAKCVKIMGAFTHRRVIKKVDDPPVPPKSAPKPAPKPAVAKSKKKPGRKIKKRRPETPAQKISRAVADSQKVQPLDENARQTIVYELFARRLAGQDLKEITRELGEKIEIGKLNVLFPSPRDFIEYADKHNLFK